jgi:arylsulfatase A-like enzyme
VSKKPLDQKPNLLLIQTDQQSAETLALYGNPLVRTPNLEWLAERGVVFESASRSAVLRLAVISRSAYALPGA